MNASLNRIIDPWCAFQMPSTVRQGCDKPVELDFSNEAFVRALGRACDISEPSIDALEALPRSPQQHVHA